MNRISFLLLQVIILCMTISTNYINTPQVGGWLLISSICFFVICLIIPLILFIIEQKFTYVRIPIVISNNIIYKISILIVSIICTITLLFYITLFLSIFIPLHIFTVLNDYLFVVLQNLLHFVLHI